MAKLKEITEKQAKLIMELALEPDEICCLLGYNLEDLETAKPLLARYYLGDKRHFIAKFKRESRAYGRYGELKTRLRTALRMQIADMILREMGDLEDIIGYDIEDLLFDFHKKFNNNMNWSNWGDWQIDHIKPRTLFTTKELKECFALDNLQPLPKYENLSKGSKYNG